MKKLLSVFAALMIIFTFSLPAFATDTADTIDTSNWITHEIPELGISLALPQGTKVYTRDSLAKGNLDNDPNYDKAVEDFKEESRYFIASNPNKNIFLDVRKIKSSHPMPYPWSSLSTLTDRQRNKIIASFNLDTDSGNLYSILKAENNIFIQHPPFCKSKYTFYLYDVFIHNINYGFDFRLESSNDITQQISTYHMILSTIDFSRVQVFSLYDFLFIIIVIAIAYIFLAKLRKRLNRNH